ncbi:DNA repair ATPase [Mycolicibacter heraklionensis]|nr:DNA repair ATPase [Mycolicibacter heraklionensis]
MTTDSGSSAPIPRPGPRPGPKPGARPAPAVILPPPTVDPHQFGRVDDDGTVWLITPAGERQIGSWQAGDREAAFAHFGRRYDDMSTEVTLLEERLSSGSGDARKIKASAAALADQLPTASILGDVEALAARITAVIEHADSVAAAGRAQRDEQRAAATARKEALAAEAEELAANSTQWKATGDRLRAILDEWRTITGLDRKVDDALWKRYAAARDSFNRRRGSHFAELDRGRAGAREEKERLCKRAEELSSSTDWAATSAAFRQLLVAWKATGRASKDADEALWQRFKAAQDTFFSARNAANAERDAELEANAAAKEALLVEAERIDPTNQNAARAALRSIVTKWDALGKVPRERSAELERRLRAVEKKVRDAGAAAEAAVVDPEAEARAAQFRTRAEQFERQALKAQAAGRDKEAAEATANAEQWRQWAQAAERALNRR